MSTGEETTTPGMPEASLASGIEAPTPMSVSALPPAPWKWWEVLVVFALSAAMGIVISGGIVVMTGDESSVGLMLASIVMDLTVLGSLLIWLQTAYPDWVQILGWPPRLWPELWAGFVRGMVLALLGSLVLLGLAALFGAIAGETPDPRPQLDPGLAGFEFFAAVIFAIVIAPVTEEMVFRAGLFRAFRATHGFVVSALLSAVIFGAIHYEGGPWQDALLRPCALVFVGFGFAFIYERRGTILASIVAHAAFNVVGVVLVMSGR